MACHIFRSTLKSPKTSQATQVQHGPPCSAGDNAIFAFPETRLGIIPGAGGTQRLPRVVGRTKAKELIFTGSRLDARRAYDIGGAAAHREAAQGPKDRPQLTPTPAEQLRCTPSCSC